MFISPMSVLFFFFMLSGILLSISSDSWFGAWCGLELNLMSFIPWVSIKKNQYSSEASLKYFLVQAMGSSFFILSSILIFSSSYFSMVITIALLLKLGAAPLHFWFPQVMEGMNWIQCIVLMSIQKIAPMYLLSYSIIEGDNFIVFWSSIISASVGALGGINQVFLRKVLAFSSINHMSWMLFSMLISESAWALYFLFYSLVSFSVVILFHFQQVFHLNQLSNFNKPSWSLMSFFSLLSLGGLPPFTGFIPKWILIQEMISMKLFFPFLVLLLSSLLTLYYYLRVTIMFMSMASPKLKWSMKYYYQNEKVPFFVVINLIGLLFPFIFILL